MVHGIKITNLAIKYYAMNVSISELAFIVFAVIYFITVLSIIGVVISENRNPVKSLAWITVLLLLPIIGLGLYAFFGRSMRSKRLISKKNKKKLRKIEPFRIIDETRLPLSRESQQEIRLAMSLTGARYFPANKIDVYTDCGKLFEQFKRDISAAKHYIHIQFYIFEDDKLGHEIRDLLVAKASEGVKVRVIYDHVGSFKAKESFFADMRMRGVTALPFMKVTFPQLAQRINWRNHRKISIIDGVYGYIGGMNIADRYVEGLSFGRWRDTHVRITGPAVAGLQYNFAVDWNFMGQPLLGESTKHYNVPDDAEVGVQIVSSGPTSPWGHILMLFLKVIGNAKKRIYIQTPYFLPTESLLKALQAAALAKVDVRIMIPRRSDSWMLRLASFSYVSECLKAGIKIYLFNDGMLHAKTLLVDDEFFTTGSTNFDFRSFEHNFECNVLVYNQAVNKQMADVFINDQRCCLRVLPSIWRNRPVYEKCCESLVRLLSPVL